MTDYNELQILCSAGDGQMSAQACLECAFQQGHPPCNMDYGLLKAMYTNPDRDEIHVTDLTSCLLKAWYAKRQPQPEYPHEMLARHVGTMFHATLEISDELGQSEVPIAFDEVTARSTGPTRMAGLLTTKSTKYIYLDKLPYSSHDLQVNIYGYMRRKLGYPVTSLAIQYVCLSGPTKCRTHRKTVEWIDGGLRCPTCGITPKNAHQGFVMVEIPMMTDEEIEAIFKQRAGTLRSALNNGHQPEAEPGWLCDYCSFVHVCPAGMITQNGYA